MTTAAAHSPTRHAHTPWLRRLLPRRADRMQGLWSTLLVLATMVACAWIATSDLAAVPEDASASVPTLPAAPRS